MNGTYKPEGNLIKQSENYEYISSETILARAKNTGKILEANVSMCDKNMNLHVDLPCMEGIIPKEEAVFCREGEELKDIAVITRVGKPVCFTVSDIIISEGKKTALLSRKDAQKRCIFEYLTQKTPGDIISCRVTHTEGFGAFVDVGCGVTSLLPTDCISTSRISHPLDRIKPGDDIRCIVKSVDCDNFRMFLTMKELLGTWEENAARFSPSQTVQGIIRSVEDYGVFIELAPNLAALAEYKDGVEIGNCAAVYIKSITPEKMKIKLSIVDIYEKPEKIPALEYFISDDVSHIDSWQYSPQSSVKRIETVFI